MRPLHIQLLLGIYNYCWLLEGGGNARPIVDAAAIRCRCASSAARCAGDRALPSGRSGTVPTNAAANGVGVAAGDVWRGANGLSPPFTVEATASGASRWWAPRLGLGRPALAALPLAALLLVAIAGEEAKALMSTYAYAASSSSLSAVPSPPPLLAEGCGGVTPLADGDAPLRWTGDAAEKARKR